MDEGFVQFGENMYHQSSGIIFIETSPVPDLANIFVFMHEYEFLKEMYM